jgi:two-component system cell cycle response regulator DivK
MDPAPAPAVSRILAVEDEPDHLMAVEMLFRGEPGFEFFGAGTTAEAERILGTERIDLILLDLALPGEDGLTFCRRIRAQEAYRALPIIAFSAFPRQVYEERARAAGCTAYIDKPFQPRALVETVRKYLP